eukprot:Gb_27819 [translate_table: standard]
MLLQKEDRLKWRCERKRSNEGAGPRFLDLTKLSGVGTGEAMAMPVYYCTTTKPSDLYHELGGLLYERPESSGGTNSPTTSTRDEQWKAAGSKHNQDVVMPGFRFHPTEEELIEFYLRRKVEGKHFNIELITFVDLYRYDPWELPGFATIGEKEWFFYVPRDRKYRNGDRPNRVTTSGYWKATGADRMIRNENFRCIGLKKTLVFYTGKAPKGTRTNWIMNEYRLPQLETERLIQKNELSLCRVYKKAGSDEGRGVDSKKSQNITAAQNENHLEALHGDHPNHMYNSLGNSRTSTDAHVNAKPGSTVDDFVKLENTPVDLLNRQDCGLEIKSRLLMEGRFPQHNQSHQLVGEMIEERIYSDGVSGNLWTVSRPMSLNEDVELSLTTSCLCPCPTRVPAESLLTPESFSYLLNPPLDQTAYEAGQGVDRLLSLQDYENNDQLSTLFLAPELQAQWQQPLAAQANGSFLCPSKADQMQVEPQSNTTPPLLSLQAQEPVEEVGSCHMNSVEEAIRRTDQEEDAVESAPLHGNANQIKADHICSHPLFMRFLAGHIDSSKVGVSDQNAVAQLDQLIGQHRVLSTRSIPIGTRPDLDQFMVAYCSMLDSYREEINNTFMETKEFLKALDNSIEGLRMGDLAGVNANLQVAGTSQKGMQGGTPMDMEAKLQATMHAMMEEGMPPSLTNIQMSQITQVTKELKEAINSQKLKKYSRLPEDATKILQDWWDKNHGTNPYPSKNDKLEFVRCTGLEPKQVENWFSNQRKKSCN